MAWRDTKLGTRGKLTCATTLYWPHFSDQVIKEHFGHRSLEAVRKYKRTGSDQQYDISMALIPKISKQPRSAGKENKPSSIFHLHLNLRNLSLIE